MVQENGTGVEWQWFRIDFTGSRKYSVPRLASTSGEEEARRAMPPRSGTDPGGSRASGPLSRWLGTLGNKVGLGSSLRSGRGLPGRVGSSVTEGSLVAVAIARLAKHVRSISLFVRFVKHYLLFLRLGADAACPCLRTR